MLIIGYLINLINITGIMLHCEKNITFVDNAGGGLVDSWAFNRIIVDNSILERTTSVSVSIHQTYFLLQACFGARASTALCGKITAETRH